MKVALVLVVKGAPTKSVMLTAQITKRVSENLHQSFYKLLINDLIAKRSIWSPFLWSPPRPLVQFQCG